jgi:cysteine desulfurase
LRSIYMDYSATTPVREEVVEAMLPIFREGFGNPSSAHAFGRKPRETVETAREKVAAAMGASSEEIYFTGGGTESDNLAILGVMESAGEEKRHFITTVIEHNAVLESGRYLEKQGCEVTWLPVDERGMVSPDDIKKALRPDTALVSVILANNEVGTVQHLAELTAPAREAGVPFHTDAVQAFGKIPVDVDDLGVDLLSISSHKIYGPKGVGALYVRRGKAFAPLLHGGHHERGKRAGTENVPGIVGLARAAEMAVADIPVEGPRLDRLRTMLWEGISAGIDRVRLNGHPESRLPHVASISVEGIEGEAILLSMDIKGIAISTGSACMSDTLEASHVLLAMGIEPVLAQGTLRFSLGLGNKEEDIEYVVEQLPGIVRRLREMSPLA